MKGGTEYQFYLAEYWIPATEFWPEPKTGAK